MQEIGMEQQPVDVAARNLRHRLGLRIVQFGASLMLVGLVVLAVTRALPGG
jgi:hypothetical protein